MASHLRAGSWAIRSLVATAAAGLLLPAPPATATVAAGSCGPGARASVAETVDGYDVRVCASEAYAFDPARVQSVADTLGAMIHGPELGLLSVSIITPADVVAACGSPDALACYAGDRIVLPGELRAGSPPLAYLLTHEYGHHILAHSRNDPWPAHAWGTKRWASSLGVCPAAKRHELFLGYASMPCEAFAESFATAQFPTLHMPWSYTDLLAPDDATETAIRADVLHPWTGPTSRRYTGRLGIGRSRTLRLAFPLDGTARLTATGAVKLRLELLAGGKLVARAQPGRSASKLSFTICGSRHLTARLTAVRGSGAYALTVSRP